MSKNTNTKVNTVSSLDETNRKIAELTSQIAAMQENAKQIQEQERIEMLAKVNALPVQFNLETMGEFLDMVNRVTGRKAIKRTHLTVEAKASIVEMLKSGNNSTKELAEKFKVSAATINSIKKDNGLTTPRAVKTPVVESTPSATQAA